MDGGHADAHRRRARGLTRATAAQLALGSLLVAAACLASAGCSLRGGGDDDGATARRGLSLHPENPRYLVFRGKPTVLITSGEHYGAVVNADFDYERYLDELARHGFNQTRVFSGSYVEAGAPTSEGSPGSTLLRYDNTLAPRPGRLVSPWRQPEKDKFDLTKWNSAYFERLKRFVAEAGRRGIVVELVFFSALYDFPSWEASPFNAKHNVNGVGAIDAKQLYTLDNGGVLEFQDALVRKLVRELRRFDNLYYEVINEGWAGNASGAWEDHIIRTIEKAESDFAEKHLIARNYSHKLGRIDRPNPSVSIFNFHYQRSVSHYGNLEGVLAFDETGLQGPADEPYRTDAWYFMLSGGGVYSHLDFSFTPRREDGTLELPADAPGGGGPALRRQLAVLKRFLERFDLPQTFPAHEIVKGAPAGSSTRVLAEPGNAYAIYVNGGRSGPLTLDLDAGNYRAEWVDTKDGTVKKTVHLDHPGFAVTLVPPPYEQDIALAITAE